VLRCNRRTSSSGSQLCIYFNDFYQEQEWLEMLVETMTLDRSLVVLDAQP
jgi:hypothetical protein